MNKASDRELWKGNKDYQRIIKKTVQGWIGYGISSDHAEIISCFKIMHM